MRPFWSTTARGATAPDKQKGGLRLDSRGGALHGGDSGPALGPGEPDEEPARLGGPLHRQDSADAAQAETLRRADRQS